MSKKPETEPTPPKQEPKLLRSNRWRGGYEMPDFKPRQDRSATTRKIVIIGSAITGVLTLLLIGAAALQLLVVEPNAAVATVGGESISKVELQRRMKAEFQGTLYNLQSMSNQITQLSQSGDEGSQFLVQIYQQQFQQLASQVDSGQVANSAMNSLIADKLVRQEATRRGLTASAAESEREMQTSMGYYAQTPTPFPTVTPQPTVAGMTETLPTATPRLQPTSISEADLEQGRQRAQTFYTDLGYPASELQKSYEQSVIIRKVKEAFAATVTTTAPHVQYTYIQFTEQATATLALNRLTSGAITVAALVSETNAITQPVSVGNGVAGTWAPSEDLAGQYGDAIAAALTGGALGKPSAVLTGTQGGFYIVVPTAREVRAYAEDDLKARQDAAYTDWLSAAVLDTNTVKKLVDPATLVPKDLRDLITNLRQQLNLP